MIVAIFGDVPRVRPGALYFLFDNVDMHRDAVRLKKMLQ